MHLYFSLQVGTAFAVTNWQGEILALQLQRQIENLALHLQRQVEILALHLQRQIEKLALQSYCSSLFAEQCQTSLNKKTYIGAFLNMAKPVRTVKLLNEIQNIWASDLSNGKILITLLIRMRSIFARHLRNIDQIFPLILRKVFRSDRSGH